MALCQTKWESGKKRGVVFSRKTCSGAQQGQCLGLSGLLHRCCLVMKDQTATRHLWGRAEGFQGTSSGSSDLSAQPALQQGSGETAGDLQLCNLLSPARLCWRTLVTAVPPLRQQLRSILRWQCLERTARSFISFIATVLLLLRGSLRCPHSQRRLSFPALLFYTPSPAERSRAVPARPAPAGNGSDSGACPRNEPSRLPKPWWPLRRQQKPLPGAAAGGTGGTSHPHGVADLARG